MKHFRREKIGAAPGSLIHTGVPASGAVVVNHIAYDEGTYEEKHSVDPSTLELDDGRVHWIEVVGVHDSKVMEKIGQRLNLHPLFLEDVMNIHQRPKVDDWGEGIFIVLRVLQLEHEVICDGQISIFMRKNLVLSFHEHPTPLFAQLKERLCARKGIIRKQGSDFLAYALIDTVIDNYYLLLQKIDDMVEALEEQVSYGNATTHLREIHDCQRKVIYLRKSILPVREVIGHLLREEDEELLTPTTRFYLKDVYDHAVQVTETLDLLRDLSKGLLDITISTMSHRMNEVIKILTVVSTIFVPMTFISSFYGMNFVNMPEIHWKWGYLTAVGLMAFSTLYMIRYFKKKRWF